MAVVITFLDSPSASKKIEDQQPGANEGREIAEVDEAPAASPSDAIQPPSEVQLAATPAPPAPPPSPPAALNPTPGLKAWDSVPPPPEPATSDRRETAAARLAAHPVKSSPGATHIVEQPRQTSLTSKPGVPLDCLAPPLRAVLEDLEARFGPVTLVSTTHLHTDNHSPGSARAKMHHACRAVDIRTTHEPKQVAAYLRSRPEVGGVNTYRNRVVHFDLNEGYKASARRR